MINAVINMALAMKMFAVYQVSGLLSVFAVLNPNVLLGETRFARNGNAMPPIRVPRKTIDPAKA